MNQEIPTNSPVEQTTSPKKKALLFVIIIFEILIIVAGVIVLIILSTNQKQIVATATNADATTPTADNNEETTEKSPEPFDDIAKEFSLLNGSIGFTPSGDFKPSEVTIRPDSAAIKIKDKESRTIIIYFDKYNKYTNDDINGFCANPDYNYIECNVTHRDNNRQLDIATVEKLHDSYYIANYHTNLDNTDYDMQISYTSENLSGIDTITDQLRNLAHQISTPASQPNLYNTLKSLTQPYDFKLPNPKFISVNFEDRGFEMSFNKDEDGKEISLYYIISYDESIANCGVIVAEYPDENLVLCKDSTNATSSFFWNKQDKYYFIVFFRDKNSVEMLELESPEKVKDALARFSE